MKTSKAIKTTFSLLSFILLLLTSLQCSSKKEDSSFVKACKISDQFNWGQSASKKHNYQKFMDTINEKIPNTPAAVSITTLRSFAGTGKAQRYVLFVQAAMEGGDRNFSCPSMETNFRF